MRTIDLCHINQYSPLITAVDAICHAKKNESITVVTDDTSIFKDLKTYLSECHIGFREIYEEERMSLQFTI